MLPHVKTRWTDDGLVEITLDVDTAHSLYNSLPIFKGGGTSGMYLLTAALANTLDAQRKP